MPVIKKIKLKNGIMAIWKWTELPDQLKELYPEYKNDKEFIKIKNHKRQIEWITTHILLKDLCHDKFKLYHKENGKPIIRSKDFSYISISHSKNMAGIFLNKKSDIGLDIENSKRNFKRVITKYLSNEELLLAGSIPNGLGLFWCIKEAAFKISKKGSSNYIKEISIFKDNNKKLSVKIIPDNIIYPVHYLIIEDEIVVYLTEEDNHF